MYWDNYNQISVILHTSLQVLTGNIANITNATVTGLSVVPATPPPSPPSPVIPPIYENVTTDEGDPVIIPIDEVIDVPTIATPETNDTTVDSTVTIDFVIPSEMRVTMEPLPVVITSYHICTRCESVAHWSFVLCSISNMCL